MSINWAYKILKCWYSSFASRHMSTVKISASETNISTIYPKKCIFFHTASKMHAKFTKVQFWFKNKHFSGFSVTPVGSQNFSQTFFYVLNFFQCMCKILSSQLLEPLHKVHIYAQKCLQDHNQSINQAIKQSINQSINQSIKIYYINSI